MDVGGGSLDFELTHKMVVREAMSSPVVSIIEDENMVQVAKIMADHNVGAVIVTKAGGHPVGIVTERDIVVRTIAKSVIPQDVRVKEVMSSPLRTVEPDMSLTDAMSLMSKLNIRRLGVTYKDELVGVISVKDILRLVPALIEIVQERSRILSVDTRVGPSLVGYCDRCEMYSTNLRSANGEFLCEDCRTEIVE